MRKTVIAGNWKMNMTPSATTVLINEMKAVLPAAPACDVVLCVPYVDIAAAVEAAKGSIIKIGAENVHYEAKGAYTGEVSAQMLCECGVEYVIVGHSERRQYFGETDNTVNLRAKAAIAAGLTAIICVGENESEYDTDITDEVVSRQTKLALLGMTEADLKKVIIAYEPVWAIGTGKTATPEDADRVCGVIRSVVAGKFGKAIAEELTVQYGGSMNADNAAKLLAKENIDGGLIGGASLVADKFATIVKSK